MQSRDFSLYGAVDLGARQAAAKRQQERQSTGGSEYVIDVSEASFKTDVIDRSHQVPVVVDFWAEWCGPCKQLGPLLEKLAREAAGQWILAKLDIDANQQLAAQMGVQSIPLVVAFVGGRVAPLFNGALPEAQLRQVLDEFVAALREQGLVPEPAPQADGETTDQPEGDPVFAAAEEALRGGDVDTAATAFQKILEETPGDPQARLGLAQAELLRRVGGIDESQARRAAAQQPADPRAQCQVADLEMVAGRFEEAFDRILGAVRRTEGDDRDLLRKHLLELFEVLPQADPAVAKARRALSMALF